MAFIKYPKGTPLSDGSVADGNTEYNDAIVKPVGQSSNSSTSTPKNTSTPTKQVGVTTPLSVDVGRGTPYTFDVNLMNAMISAVNNGQLTLDQAASALVNGATGSNADAVRSSNPIAQIKDYLRSGGASKASSPTFIGNNTPTVPQNTSTPQSEYVAVTTPISSNTSSYTGSSIVDFLNSTGQPSDYASRKSLAESMGITNYTGTAAQNSQMLNTLRTQAGGYKETKSFYTYNADGGLIPVTDTGIIKQLQSGQIQAKTYGSLYEVPLPNLAPTKEEEDFYNSDVYKNATDGQKEVIDSIIQAVSTNDAEKAELLKKAFAKATADADPIYKQELKLALDQLTRGFTAEDEDLTYQESKLNNNLSDLKKDIEYSAGKLTLDEEAELRGLQRDFEQRLDTTVNDMANAGFTNSSRRTKAEAILSETKGNLVESTKREFAAKARDLTEQGLRGQRDTTAQIEYLRKLSERNKTTLGRNVEKEVGSGNLPATSGYTALGGLVGDAEKRKQADIDRAALDMYGMGFVY